MLNNGLPLDTLLPAVEPTGGKAALAFGVIGDWSPLLLARLLVPPWALPVSSIALALPSLAPARPSNRAELPDILLARESS